MLDILPDTNPLMRKTSRRVRHVDNELRDLSADMYDVMVENWGIGLAAIQVGIRKRLFIYEIPQREVQGYETCHTDSSTDIELDTGNISNGDTTPDEEEESGDPGYTGDYTVCINPRIISKEGSFIDDEGCLSKVGWIAKVERAYKITFQAYDLDMKKFERTVTGLEARCVQHETDHLDGILFTERAQPGTLREITEEEMEEEMEEEGQVDETTGEELTNIASEDRSVGSSLD